ncbi:tetratricopeptide repeat protein [Actinoplanes sp. NPDC024001]|uniref:tetratricopeptide repeat protein n=1 Tax=Actinoplanes sp. NPDC024001 TaxID=3154598 RepID=UPI0034093548
MTSPAELPGYLGRVVDSAGTAVGTCFQIQPGVLVTAWHVVADCGAEQPGADVHVGALSSGPPRIARVHAVDELRDLAVLTSAEPLDSCVPALAASDSVDPATDVHVTGVSRFLNDQPFAVSSTAATWHGPAVREDQVPLGVINAPNLVKGMSGAPVRRVDDGSVVGVVSARYQSGPSAYLQHAVWVARTEDIAPLLVGLADVRIAAAQPPGSPLDLLLSVSETDVRLAGAGIDVSAPHRGVSPGLAHAMNDVLRRRAQPTRLEVRSSPDDPPPAAEAGAMLSLRRAGDLLSDSFLPGPLRAALIRVMTRATGETAPVRLAVDAPAYSELPWEAVPDPVSGRPLALHPLVSVFRKVPAGRVSPGPGPLRIVVAIASPETGGGPLLDYEHELSTVINAMTAAKRNAAQVTIVPFATTSAIRAALAEGGAHVLHLSAHGRPGELILEDEAGDAREITAARFVEEAIPPGAMPPVVALAACYTDIAAQPEGGSFAAALTAAGASAVIGIQTSVTDRYATKLFARLYAELASRPGVNLINAVADARRMVQRELAGSNRPIESLLAALDEWSVVTVLAAQPEVIVVDAATRNRMPPPCPVPVGGILARPAGQFVGRRSEQRHLPSMLTNGAVTGLVLLGIGGIGKTTLAAEIVLRITSRDPAWRVVTCTGRVTVDGIFAAVAATLRAALLRQGLTAGPETEAVQMLTRMDLPWRVRFALLHDDLLTRVPLFLVLDEFEENLTGEGRRTILDSSLADLLACWILRPAESRMVITSRFPFVVPDDVDDLLHWHHLAPMSSAESRKLMWALPSLQRHVFDAATADRIWHCVGGHPRTLEYLDSLLGNGKARFSDVTRRLTSAVRKRLGDHKAEAWLAETRSLDAAIGEVAAIAADDVLLAEHLDHLGTIDGAVDLLIDISVYRQPVDRDALAVESVEKLDHLLAAIRFTGLLHVFADGRVVMHRWTAVELHERWRASGQAQQVERAHSAAALYWLELAQTSSASAAVRVEYWDEARHHFLAAGAVLTASNVAQHLCDALDGVGAWDREVSLSYEMLDRLPAESFFRPDWHARIGNIAARRGDLAGAEQHYQRAQAASQHMANRGDTARFLHQRGTLAHRRGDIPGAERHYRQALAIFSELEDAKGIAASHGHLGMCLQSLGRFAEAERHYRYGLEMSERAADRAGMASGYGRLGKLASEREDVVEAERFYREALAIFEEMGDAAEVANVHHHLGTLAQLNGDLPGAERWYQQALAVAEALGDRYGIAYAYHHLGTLAQALGDHDEAEYRYTQALKIEEEIGDARASAATCAQLGSLYSEVGPEEKAVELLLRSFRVHEELGVPQQPLNLRRLAEVREACGPGAFRETATEYLDDGLVQRLEALLDKNPGRPSGTPR